MQRNPWILILLCVGAVVLAFTLPWRPGNDEDHSTRAPKREVPVDDAAPPLLRGRNDEPASEVTEVPASVVDAPLSSARLEVVVVDERGEKPIRDATLTLSDAKGETTVRRSDALGAAAYRDLAPGTWTLRVVAAGRVPSDVHVFDLRGGRTTERRVSLEEGLPLSGRVIRRSDGRPVSGASVTCRHGGSLGGTIAWSSRAPFGTVQADVDGAFRFPALPRDTICTLRVRARGYRTLEHPFTLSPETGSGIVVQLTPGGRLQGRVYSADGNRVAGARVFLDCDVEIGADADAEGRYEIEGLAFDREYRVNATAPGHADSEDVDAVLVTAAEPEAALDLTLRLQSVLQIDLTDESGKPIEAPCEATLGAWPVHGWEAAPDGSVPGRWRFDAVEPGRQRLQVKVRGFLPVDRYAQVQEGGTTELTLRLVRGVDVTGIVVDDLGAPVPEVRVVACFTGQGRAHEEDGYSDDEGRFHVRGLAPGPHRIEGYVEGHHGPAIDDVEAPASEVRLVLARRPQVAFRLRMPAGRSPPADVMVSVRTRGGGSGTGHRWTEDRIETWVLPAPCRLIIAGEGFATWHRDLDLAPGEHLDLGAVPLEEGVALRVEVRDASGMPVPGAVVRLTSDSATWRLMAPPITGASGACTLLHVNPGPQRVEVRADGYAHHLAEVEVDASGGALRILLDAE